MNETTLGAHVRVPKPEQWWVAARDDLPEPTLVADEPWSEDENSRWAPIAGVINAVAAALATGGYTVDPDEPASAWVPVDLEGLDRLDRSIVRSWFHPGPEAPRGDAWAEDVGQGSRRLVTAWRAAPDALLPVRSELLQHLDDVPIFGEALTDVLAHSATEGLPRVPAAVATRSPQYVDELRRVADWMHRESFQDA